VRDERWELGDGNKSYEMWNEALEIYYIKDWKLDIRDQGLDIRNYRFEIVDYR
jgi:hypothetical protein